MRATRGDPLEREVRVELKFNRSDASSNLGGATRRPARSAVRALTLVRRRELGGGRIEVRARKSPAVLTLTWGGEPPVAELVIGERAERLACAGGDA